MNELYKIIPFIIGAAISPVLLVTTLLVLAQSKQPVAKTLAFLIGAMATITVITIIVFYIASIRSVAPDSKQTLVHIVIGIVLILLSLDIYRRGPTKPNNKAKSNKHKSLWGYILLGIALMISNFTTIAMVFAIAVELRTNDIAGLTKVFYLVTTIISSLLPILLPLMVLVIAGRHSAVILNKLSGFMKTYAHIITAIFFGLLGIYSMLKPFT